MPSLDLPPDPEAERIHEAARGFRPYPAYPDDETGPTLQDPVPGYFAPPATAGQTVTPAAPPTVKELKQAWKQIKKGTPPDQALAGLGGLAGLSGVTGAAGVTVPAAAGPDAPYGRDRRTGEPLSDKYKLVGALLQLCLGPLGVGRFYLGYVGIGFLSMAVLTVAIVTTATAFLWLPWWILFVALGLWSIADFVLIISGHVRDADGRKLK
jgi:TM2 domain-containing membrane protein YozV